MGGPRQVRFRALHRVRGPLLTCSAISSYRSFWARVCGWDIPAVSALLRFCTFIKYSEDPIVHQTKRKTQRTR